MKTLDPVGVEYVIATPNGRIVLRPYRQPITDTLIVPKGGLPMQNLFTDHLKFPDGSPKEWGIHTNMVLDGQLGKPCLFDFSQILFHVTQFKKGEDVFTALRSLRFQFVYGQSRIHVNFSGADLKPYIHLDPLEEMPRKGLRDVLRAELNRHARKKGFWSWYRLSVMNGNLPRRIDSMEVFRLDVEQPITPKLSGPVHFKVLMDGILYHL